MTADELFSHFRAKLSRLLTGADLKYARKAAGMSQRELAVKAGVSRDTVCYWERKSVVAVNESPTYFGSVISSFW